MKLFEDFFSSGEISHLLEVLSDIRHVSLNHKFIGYLKENESLLDKISLKLYFSEKNKIFFDEWGFYQNPINLDEREVSTIISALEIAQDVHSNESELITYTGLGLSALNQLKVKFQEFREQPNLNFESKY